MVSWHRCAKQPPYPRLRQTQCKIECEKCNRTKKQNMENRLESVKLNNAGLRQVIHDKQRQTAQKSTLSDRIDWKRCV